MHPKMASRAPRPARVGSVKQCARSVKMESIVGAEERCIENDTVGVGNDGDDGDDGDDENNGAKKYSGAVEDYTFNTKG